MAVPSYIAKLKGRHIKTVSFFLGLPSTGLKRVQEQIITNHINQVPPPGEFNRILSIDMGIRNLGVCMLEASHLAQHDDLPKTKSSNHPRLTVSAWEKVDVLSQLRIKRTYGISESDSSSVERKEIERLRNETDEAPIQTDYSPQNLAETAYALVSSLLARHRPSCILVERQRFRSGGNAAVQEWTIRVNMLEHMMWACLKTLRAQAHSDTAPPPADAVIDAAKSLEAVYGVSPSKVAKFWCGGLPQDFNPAAEIPRGGATMNSTRTRVKVDKKDKVAVVQTWVDQWKAGSGKGSVHLDFEGQAEGTARAFQSGDGRRRRKKSQDDSTEDVEAIGKLDDLADCLLQGVAWVKWEENRRKLAETVARQEENSKE